MANYLAALAVKHPEFGDAYLGGQRHAQQQQMNALGMETRELQNKGIERDHAVQGLRLVGGVAMGAMDGDINGQADPEKWAQGMAELERMGMDVSRFKDNPDMAQMLARGSLDTLKQVNVAKSQQEMELALKRFDANQFRARRADARADELHGWKREDREKGVGKSVTYSKSPSYHTVDGKLRFGVFGDDASFKSFPEIDPADPFVKVDTGLGTQLLGRRTGEPIKGEVSKNVQETAAQKRAGSIEGEKQATAAIDLPKVEDQSRYAIGAIDAVLNAPDMTSYIGNIQGRIWDGASQGRQDFANKLKLIKSKQFAMAFETLKGGGQITEYEGKTAADALTVLETTSSDKEFISALNNLKGVITDLAARARKIAQPRVPLNDIMKKYGD